MTDAFCEACLDARFTPHAPAHIVHPDSEVPGEFDVWGRALCLDCGANWHHYNGQVKLVV